MIEIFQINIQIKKDKILNNFRIHAKIKHGCSIKMCLILQKLNLTIHRIMWCLRWVRKQTCSQASQWIIRETILKIVSTVPHRWVDTQPTTLRQTFNQTHRIAFKSKIRGKKWIQAYFLILRFLSMQIKYHQHCLQVKNLQTVSLIIFF